MIRSSLNQKLPVIIRQKQRRGSKYRDKRECLKYLKQHRRIENMKNQKSMKHTIKCKYCGKTDNVQYLGGLDWFCNKRCHYNYRHINDNYE